MNTTSKNLTCWAISEDVTGHRNQAVGLANRLGFACVEKVVPKAPKIVRWLSPRLWPCCLKTADMAPPWPDAVISCGRGAVAYALAVKNKSGGKTFAAHILSPYVKPSLFDAVILPEHDRLAGTNILQTIGAPHHVTPEKLAAGVEKFRAQFANLPRPLIAVLVGGTSKHKVFTPDMFRDLTKKLAAAAKATGGGLAITPSRRTGA